MYVIDSRLRERAIREKLKTLTEMLPYEVCKNSRPSRTMILEKAVEYIASLEEDIRLLEKKLGMKITCEFRMDSNDDSPVYSGICKYFVYYFLVIENPMDSVLLKGFCEVESFAFA